MKQLIRMVLCAATLALGACAGDKVQVAAPTLAPTDLASASKTPGRYAVWIQTGGWNTDVSASGFACSAWTFPIALEDGYLPAAQAAFSQSFENITFTTATLKAEDIRAQGLDAQIIVYQGGLTAEFTPVPGFFTTNFTASLGIEGTVAVVGPDGLTNHGTARGVANGGTEGGFLGTCNDAGAAIGNAAGVALKTFILDAVNRAKLTALEMQLKQRRPTADLTQ